MRAFIVFSAAAIFAQAAVTINGIKVLRSQLGSLSAALKQTAANMFATAAGTKTMDAAVAGSTIRGKILTGIMKGLKAIVGLVGAAFKAAFAVLVTPIGAAAAAVGVLIASLYLWHRATKEQTQYLNDLKEAQKGVREEANKQARAITTVQEKMEAERQLVASLIKSYEALAEAKAMDRQKFFGNKEGVAIAEKGARDAEERLERARAKGTEGLTDSRDKDDLIERLKLEKQIKDVVFSGLMARANGEEKSVLLAQRQKDIQDRINVATELREGNRKSNDFDTKIADSITELEGRANVIKGAMPDAPDGKFTGVGSRGFGVGAQEAEQERAKQERAQARNELAPINLRIAALRRLQEIRTKIASLGAWDEGSINAQDDLKNLNSLKAEQEQITQELLLQNKERERAGKLAKDQLEIADMESSLTYHAGRGNMSNVRRSRQELEAKKDEVFLSQRRQELLDQGLDPGIADGELANRKEQRDTDTRNFRRDQAVEIAANEARVKGDKRGARGIEDQERLRSLTLQNIIEGDMTRSDAEAMAERQLKAEIGAQEKAKGSSIVADQFQRLGLGGFASGSDPAQRSRDRMVKALESSNTKLDAIIGEGGPI